LACVVHFVMVPTDKMRIAVSLAWKHVTMKASLYGGKAGQTLRATALQKTLVTPLQAGTYFARFEGCVLSSHALLHGIVPATIACETWRPGKGAYDGACFRDSCTLQSCVRTRPRGLGP